VTGLIFLLLLGTLVLISGTRLFLRWIGARHAAIVTIEDYSGARTALDSLFTETAAIKRIFAADDMEFVSQAGAGDVQRFFLNERKRLAIQWVRMTQKQVGHLMDLHLKLASYTYEPSPRSEMKLTINYLGFILASNGLLILLLLFGPFEVVRIAAYTVHVAEYFCSVFSLRLEKIDAVKLGSARQPRLV
jgi:hypothetical protein